MPPTVVALLAAVLVEGVWGRIEAATPEPETAAPGASTLPGHAERAEPEASAFPGNAERTEPEAPTLRVHTDRVERDAVARGLETRVGPRWHAWTIDVRDGAGPDEVEVALQAPGGQTHTRTLTLMTSTVDGRSRELASGLALLVEQLPRDEPRPPTEEPPQDPPKDPPPAPSVSGWVGVGPRAALNARRPTDPDVGVSLAGGAWLWGDHVQPIAEVSWSTWSRDTLRLDALRVGAGALGGAATRHGRLWGGGGALIRAQWARAASATVVTGWWASPAVVGALQYRGRVLVVGGWLGVDLSLPPLAAHDERVRMRWGLVRPMATIHVGLRLPPGRASRSGSSGIRTSGLE